MDSIEALLRFGKRGIATPTPFFSTEKTLKKTVPLTQGERFANRQASICSDTSGRFFLKSDSVFYYSYTPAQTADGNLLLSGEFATRNSPYNYGAFLLKCDYDGNIIWNKLYDSANSVRYNYFNFHKVIELSDGSIMIAGYTNNQTTENDELLLVKTDNSGNIIWNKTYKSRLWTNGNGSADYFYVQDFKQDPFTDEIYLCGPHWVGGKALIKVNPNNGNIIWSNVYSVFGSFDTPFGFEIRQNEIRYFARTNGSINTYLNIIRINKITGDTIRTKILRSIDTSGYKVEFLSADKITVKNNGNYLLSGKCYGYWQWQWNGVSPLYQATIVEIDSNLNFVRGQVYRSAVETNSSNTVVTTYPDGSGAFSYLRVYGGFTSDFYFVQVDKNGHILKRRKKFLSNAGMPFENNAIKTPDGSDLLIKLIGDSINNENKTEFLKMHVSDTASFCLGLDDNMTFSQPVQYTSEPFTLYDSTGYNVFFETPNKTMRVTNHNMTPLPGCFQVSHCDSVKILASPAITCPGQPVAITIHKNPGCGSETPLMFDTTAVSSITKLNDTTYSLIFDTAWSGYIYTGVQGCTLHEDSVRVNILQAPSFLSLGPDTAICPSNKILLNAHSGYASYLWQNGTTDSTLIVNQPGIYYVTTENICGGTFTDTVIVSARPPVPLSIGPDRVKCNTDTIQLHAPAGFLNYTWSPPYNINSSNTQNVTVNPGIDTAYTLLAEKTPGCFAYDTLQIKVFHSPAINLGPDADFCAGDSAVLNAGAGFNSYQWSNGMASQQITVQGTGNYSVTGVTSDGCKSFDTLKILNVFSLPVVTLNNDTTLCSGDSRILNAGPGYTSYLWNNGNTSQTISVNSLGTYAVLVTDNNGCKGTDTSFIKKFLPLPANFLPADSAICNYGTVQLSATGLFNSYIWNNSSTASAISISQPGLYWLQATDKNNCTGKDSVLIFPKECLKGLYVPSAFTPNNDGKNDLLKPFLLGNVKQYKFQIFNRWGQLVFETSDLTKGWNGNFSGVCLDLSIST
jgi:gliding motility-associated-like protein